MPNDKESGRKISEMLRLDKASSNWVLLLVPIIVGVLATGIPALVDALAEPPTVPRWLEWGALVTLFGFMISLQVGIRRWMVADRLHLESKLDEYYRTNEHALQLVTSFLELKRSPKNQPFGLFAEEVINKAGRELRRMRDDKEFSLQAVAPSVEYVRRWSSLMTHLMQEPGEFDTVTNMEIWSRDYMGGPQSPYAEKNATPGVDIKIRRVFVVPSEEMLRTHNRLRVHLEDVLSNYDAKMKNAGHVETSVFAARNVEEYEQHFNSGGESDNFGIWRISKDLVVGLAVRYRHAREFGRYEITDITFKLDPIFVSEKESLFRDKYHAAQTKSLDDYMEWLHKLRNGQQKDDLHEEERPRRTDGKHSEANTNTEVVA